MPFLGSFFKTFLGFSKMDILKMSKIDFPFSLLEKSCLEPTFTFCVSIYETIISHNYV